ncbi:tetratricopeptide repeat protein [Halomonas denitrificans]|nr:winged helix-turn-helix domain-containing protein [Halomonas denitrificans]
MSNRGALDRDSGGIEFVYRFAGFELDPVRETLHDADGPVALRDHALRVLILLVERAPATVSRDDILDHVWGHQALSDSSIAQVVRDIRNALGDSARRPALVATRYGRGYQFVGEVVRHRHDAGGATRAVRTRSERTHPLPRVIAAILVVAAAMLAWQAFRGNSSEPRADGGEAVTLRAVAAESGESLSSPLVDYLAMLLGNELGADRIRVADSASPPDDREIRVRMAAEEQDGDRRLALVIDGDSIHGPRYQARFAEADELVRRGLDALLVRVRGQADEEIRLDAGLVSQSSFAIETLLRGMAAQLAGDVPRAAELFEAALAEDPAFEFARYELAIAVRRLGDRERSLAILVPMRERLDSDFWSHRINNAIGIALWQLGRPDDALDAFRRAAERARSPSIRGILLNNISLIERDLGQLERAEASSREAIRIAERTDALRLEGSARSTLASILLRLDRDDEALEHLDRARECFYERGDQAGYAAVLSRTAALREARGEYSDSETLLQLTIGIREQLGDEDGVADLRIRLARLHRYAGKFGPARRLARTGLEKAQTIGEDDLVIDGYRELAAVALAERRFDQARSYGLEAMRIAEQTGREGDQRLIRLGLLEIERSAGEQPSDAGLAATDDLIRGADEVEDLAVSVRARVLAASYYRGQQRFDDARRILQRAAELAGEDRTLGVEVEAERARLALARSALDEADRALTELESLRAAPHPLLMLRARLQAARGDRIEALETAGLARSTIGDWWSPADQERLADWSAQTRP